VFPDVLPLPPADSPPRVPWNVPAAIYAAIAVTYLILLAPVLLLGFDVWVLAFVLGAVAYPTLFAWGVRRVRPRSHARPPHSIDLIPSLLHGGLGVSGAATVLLTPAWPPGWTLTLAFFFSGWLVPLVGLRRYERAEPLLWVGVLLPLTLHLLMLATFRQGW
jgi:hypothetical protein